MAVEPLRVWTSGLDAIDLADRRARLDLAPIVRAHLDDRLDASARAGRYGSLLTHYRLVDEPSEAEVAALPRVAEGLGADAVRSVIATAEAHGLRTLVFSTDDLEPLVPAASAILLHPGPTRGRQPRADVLAVPYFLTDRAGSAPPRPDAERPSVAFCGQGATRPVARSGQAVTRLGRCAANGVRPTVVAPPLRGPVALRATALRRLRVAPGVDDRFVIRDRYRAGAAGEDDRARTQQEFDDNMRSATYALCVRGTGNFSARFSEALSFGRVPLFVDTGCVLPFEDEVDWRARTVWLDQREVGSIAERLLTSHEDVLDDPDRGADAMRALWEDRLTVDGFFRHLVPTLRGML